MADSEVAEVPVPTPVPQSSPTPVLDVEEVRAKLLAIIDANPEKNGAPDPNKDDGGGCYYFLDAQGRPICDVVPREEVVAPCCIVGHFFFDYPGALDASELLTGMMENSSIGWLLRTEQRDGSLLGTMRSVTPPIPVTSAAVNLLREAQARQDERAAEGGTWADIRDGIVNWPADETV